MTPDPTPIDRAAQAVRDIVGRLQAATEENRAATGFVDSADYCALGAARECLAAVEAQR